MHHIQVQGQVGPAKNLSVQADGRKDTLNAGSTSILWNANTREKSMKSILLASVSVVAFAGVAVAEVTFDGSAELGYNTDDGALVHSAGHADAGLDNGFAAPAGDDDNEGFYGSVDLGVNFTQELDNGLTASVSFDIEFDDATTGNLSFDDVLLSLEADMAAMYFGVTSFAAESMWDGAGDMEGDSFSEASDEVVLKGTLTYGNVEAAASYVVRTDDGTWVNMVPGADDVEQLSIGVVGTFGNVEVGAAYQDATVAAVGAGNGDFVAGSVFGVFANTSFSGADVSVAYASEDFGTNQESIGVEVSYPFGPVTVTGYYVSESDDIDSDDNLGLNVAYANGPFSVALDYDDDQGVAKTGIEGSYDVGNGLMVYAGYMTQDATEDRMYVAGTYDLGGGASLLVSYAQDDDNVQGDEIGGPDYQRGTTVELSFDF